MVRAVNEAENVGNCKKKKPKKRRRWNLFCRISAFQVQFDDRQTEADNQFYDGERFSPVAGASYANVTKRLNSCAQQVESQIIPIQFLGKTVPTL